MRGKNRWIRWSALPRRRWWIAGAALVAIGAGIGLCVAWIGPATANRSAAASPATFEVTRGDILQSLIVYGTVVPKQEYTLTFSGARVRRVLVAVGQRVEAGQTLVELDDTQQELALLQAERALEEARADGVPATIRERELSYAIARSNYEDATLRAPFSGVVTQINQATASNENWSLRLIDTSELYVQASVDQLDAPAIRVGQTGQARIEALPDRRRPVEIVEVGGMATRQGNSTVVMVTGRLPDADSAVRVGYTVELEIITAHAVDVLRVPISALTQRGTVWSVTKLVDGAATWQVVTIGAMSETYAEVRSGLSEGDRILLDAPSVPAATRGQAGSARAGLQAPGSGLPSPAGFPAVP